MAVNLQIRGRLLIKDNDVIRHYILVSRCNSLYPFPFEDNRYVAFQCANYMLEYSIASFGFMLENIGVLFL